ncbi:MAG: YbeD family protein [Gammaproteobacteria bacterium]
MPEKPIIEFPCDYLIKIIGRASDDFDARIIVIINKHQEKPFEGQLMRKDSKEKNYQSFTLTIRATSEEQLRALFEDLKKDKDVMMVL